MLRSTPNLTNNLRRDTSPLAIAQFTKPPSSMLGFCIGDLCMNKSRTVPSWPDNSVSKTATWVCVSARRRKSIEISPKLQRNGKSPLVDTVNSIERNLQKICSHASFFS
ncbi:hypothetical protein EIK77_003350 [Talaromyces pinophilus]|nr:hypothetical protein EIK77_003350 [Talaromyces pinophilus]